MNDVLQEQLSLAICFGAMRRQLGVTNSDTQKHSSNKKRQDD